MKIFDRIVQSNTEPSIHSLWVRGNDILIFGKNGWEALDFSGNKELKELLEQEIKDREDADQEIKDTYLPLSGGTMTGGISMPAIGGGLNIYTENGHTIYGYTGVFLADKGTDDILTAAASTVKIPTINGTPVLAENVQEFNLAPLENGLIPAAYLPSYVDDVLEYNSIDAFPETGETGKIYVDTTTNLTYRWSGSQYIEVSKSIGLGTSAADAYPGNLGQQNANNIASLQEDVNSINQDVTEINQDITGINQTIDSLGDTYATKEQLDEYLPLSGGTMSGGITFSSSFNTEDLPDGLSIVDRQGNIYPNGEGWTQDKGYTGIGISKDGHKFVMAIADNIQDKNNDDMSINTRKAWSSALYGIDTPGLENITSSTTVLQNFDSKENTDKIIAALTTSVDPGETYNSAVVARGYSKGVIREGQWDLPAIGILNIIYSFKDQLIPLVEQILGNNSWEYLMSQTAWSSNELYEVGSWGFVFLDGRIGNADKYNRRYFVVPVSTSIPIITVQGKTNTDLLNAAGGTTSISDILAEVPAPDLSPYATKEEIGSNTYTDSNYISKETNLTDAVVQLDEEIKATNDNLALEHANAEATYAKKAELKDYLPLSGGVLTGNLYVNGRDASGSFGISLNRSDISVNTPLSMSSSDPYYRYSSQLNNHSLIISSSGYDVLVLDKNGIGIRDKTDQDLLHAKGGTVSIQEILSQVTVPTKVSELTNDSGYQTEAQVAAKVSALVDSAPETLDTLNELAAALGDDPNFATTVTNQIAQKADKTIATTSAEGLMSATDKAKLDSITKTIWTGTQTEYEAVSPKDANTLYFITEG